MSISDEVTEKTRLLEELDIRIDAPCLFCAFMPHDEEAIRKKELAGLVNPSHATNTLKFNRYLKYINRLVIPWRQFNTVYEFKDWLKTYCDELSIGYYMILGTRKASGHFIGLCMFRIKESGLVLVKRSKDRIWRLFPEVE